MSDIRAGSVVIDSNDLERMFTFWRWTPRATSSASSKRTPEEPLWPHPIGCHTISDTSTTTSKPPAPSGRTSPAKAHTRSFNHA